MITRSPRSTCTALCSPAAKSESAEWGSPWLPVDRITWRSGGTATRSSSAATRSSGTRRYPSSLATRTFRSMLMPRSATRRPCSTASVSICWMRWMWEANVATKIRPWARRKRSRGAEPPSISETLWPGRARVDEAEVLLVAVGEEDGAEAVALCQRIREVGDHVVDAGHLVRVGEHEPAIDGDHVVAGLDEHHVQADLTEASQRDEPDGGLGRNGFHRSSFRLRASMLAPGLRHPEISRRCC